MVPYIQIPTKTVLGVPLDPWGILVTAGFLIGLEIARARAIKRGLDVRDVVDGIVFTVLCGFVGGHLVHVLAYHPEQYEKDGIWSLIWVWKGFSSFGGFFGAVFGATAFYRWIRPRAFWQHADVVMFAFPFAWIFGRAGCAIVHDHIGRKTDFFLGVDFESKFPGMGIRHDLGLYESLFTIVISAVFWACRNRPWKPGSFAVLWTVMYAPVRFFMDFLRNTDLKNADVRWGALTPAQWGCIVMAIGGASLYAWLREQPPVTVATDGDDPGAPRVARGDVASAD